MPPFFSARVGIFRRVIEAVCIPVVVEGVERILHVRVGAEEAALERVVHPAVHVYERHIPQMLMEGKPAVGDG